MTAYRRPYLFKSMLESLLANDLAGWRILIQIDPSPVADDIAGIATSLLGGQDIQVAINPARLGVRENPFRLIGRAFATGSAFNLHLKEDLLLAPDATRLASWYEANHRREWLCPNLIAGGCASAGLLSNPDYPALLFGGAAFNSLGFGVRREEWELMAPAWMTERMDIVKFDGMPTGGWHWQIYALMLNGPRLRTLQPALARATHVGRLAGEHCAPQFHDQAFHGLPFHGGATDKLDDRYLPVAELPSAVARHANLWQEMSAALRALARQRQR